MSEAEWSSEVGELAAPPKRRIPGWVWGCGAGCALALVVAVLALVVVFRVIAKATDQDKQWERLSEVLPLETPPPGVSIVGLPRFKSTSIWFLEDTAHKRQMVVMQAPPGPKASETRKALLEDSGDVQFGGPFGGFGRNEVETGSIRVQGRDLPCLRYQSFPKDSGKGPPGFLGKSLEGASIVVDLAPEDSDELLMLIFTKMSTHERVGDEELRSVLAPFRIPGGVDPPAPAPPEPAEVPAGEGK